jgi:O-acetyl-ADP-ribose deacetylase (regulator of RNase III)
MIKYKRGDLLELTDDGRYDIILNGCNCFCKMDDGIALQFAEHFPEVLHADYLTNIRDKNKLGTYIEIPILRNNKSFSILNCYTQYGYAGLDIEMSEFFDYESYEKIILDVSIKYENKKIGMPLIGTGHAGGDLQKILEITEKILKNNNVEIVIFSPHLVPKQFYTIKNKISLIIDEIKTYFEN